MEIDEGSSGSDSDEMHKEIAALYAAKKTESHTEVEQICNETALDQKLSEISLPSNIPWVETVTITSAKPIDVEDANDDLKREVSFYQQTLSAVKQGLSLLQQNGIPYKRPADYFAEMVKTDAHMARIKGQLLMEKKRMKGVEERKKQTDSKRMMRETRAHKLAQKASQHKQALNDIQQWKKGIKTKLDLDDDTNDPRFERPSMGRKQNGLPNKRRKIKDTKFGSGGRKRGQKRNTGSTAADMSGFNPGKNKNTKNFRKGKARRKQEQRK